MNLANYKGLKIKKNELKVEEKEIDKALDYLQKSRAKIITVNRPAKKGDRVEIDFEIRNTEIKIENGTSKNHPLILGEGKFLPGFEEKLERMKSGEEKEFSLKAPQNWPDKRIADKILDFKVKMNLVQERILAEINDEFAKSLGNFDSLNGLKNSIKDGLMQEKELKEKERIRLELIEKIADDSKIDLPEDLINQELENMLNEFKASISVFGLDFERYLKELNKTTDDLRKEWKKQAEKRIKIGICLKAIADKEKIEASDEEVEQRVGVENIDLNKSKEYTKNIIINEKVFELLEKGAIII